MAAYNPYYPGNYQPFNPYQAYANPYQMQTPVTPAPTPAPTVPASSAPSQSSIIWVSSEMEAMSYPIAPNNAVTLWSTAEPVVYLKQADASGKPTMKIYDLVERPETNSDGSNAAGGKVSDYATKDDLAAVVGAVQTVNGTLNTFRGEIDTIKGDLYGLAGKKKPSGKKQEVTDDE